MNKYLFLGITYFYLTCFTLLLPSSQGYEAIGWKLGVGQLYSIPLSLIIFFIFSHYQKKKQQKVSE